MEMKPPDWKHCSEAELWRYVAWHLEGAGIRSVLVGGAVVAIYTEGLYRSGDLDLVMDSFDRGHLKKLLGELGFVPGKSRYSSTRNATICFSNSLRDRWKSARNSR